MAASSSPWASALLNVRKRTPLRSGVVTLTSSSREGSSSVQAEFTLDTDLDTAASDVRDQLARFQFGANAHVPKEEASPKEALRVFLLDIPGRRSDGALDA